MLALIAIAFTIPLLLINKYFNLHNNDINNFYLGMLAIVIFGEYIRRMKFAGIISQYPLIICINGLSITSFLLYLIL